MIESSKSEPKKVEKLSRLEKSLRNPLPWIITNAVCLVLIVIFVYPGFNDWNNLRQDNSKIEGTLDALKSKNTTAKNTLNQTINKFKEAAKNDLAKEVQIFPEKIDFGKTAKTIELFSLQLQNLDFLHKGEAFDLKSVDFGNTQLVEGKNYYKTSMNISVTSDKQNLKDFITYLQTQALPERIIESVKTKEKDGPLSSDEVIFLQKNLIPILQIESIRIDNKGGGGEGDNEDAISSVKIEATIFSSPKRL